MNVHRNAVTKSSLNNFKKLAKAYKMGICELVLRLRPCYFPLKIFIWRMPAEYSRNPKNISRDKWEKEMSMKEIILRDAWMEVQALGFRYYHKLAKLYRLRIVEQKRFVVGGAKYTEDLKRFRQLQDEYLLIVNNDIKSVVDLVDFIGEQEEKIQQIEDRQKEIYRESSSRKRSIKNEEQYREYQIWHVEVQEELDELKQEKREIKRQLQLADGIVKEDLYTAYYAVSENEEIVADRNIEILGMEKEAVSEKDVAVEQETNVEVVNPDNNQNEIGRQKEQADSTRKQQTDLDGIGIPEPGGYENVDDSPKVDVFGFDIADVSGSIRMFSEVMKRLGINQDGDKLFEEFQRIYDESVGRDAGK